MVLCGQPVGMNTPWCVITATGSVGEIDCPHTSYPVSQRRTAEYPFLDGRVMYVTLTVDRISIQTRRWLWSVGRQGDIGIGIIRG